MHSTRASESPLGGKLRIIRGVGGGKHAYFLRAETMHGLYTSPAGLTTGPVG
jgi:hypothetical protein